MPDETTTIENERMMQLEQERLAVERQEEKTTKGKQQSKPAEKHYINAGEAVLLLASTGFIALTSWALDFIPFVGWYANAIINFFMGGILLLWVNGKIAQGAPKKWYKAIYYGAAGSFFGGYFGAIIYLLIQDRKILGKVAGELGEKIEEQAKKVM